MTTASAERTLREVGYRWPILLLGAAWGAAPGLGFGLNVAVDGLTSPQGLLVVGAAMTVTLGALYELDTRVLERHGDGVPLAWAYALVAPISIVGWALFGPVFAAVPGGVALGILTGPPASALLYCWQRGRVASVA